MIVRAPCQRRDTCECKAVHDVISVAHVLRHESTSPRNFFHTRVTACGSENGDLKCEDRLVTQDSEGKRWDVTRTSFGSFESLSGPFPVWRMDQRSAAEITDLAETLFDNCVECFLKLCGKFDERLAGRAESGL